MLKDRWIELCESLSLGEARYYSGVQKIIHGVIWEVSGEEFFDDSLTIQDFGYSPTSDAKLKALKRHYYDPVRTFQAKKIIKTKYEQKSYGSAGFPLTGKTKTWTKQDFCMQAATVTYYPSGNMNVCVFYRTTEIIKKFGADLIFLRTVVLPRFHKIKSIDKITFMFSNVTVHPMFYTTFLAHHPSPIKFLRRLKKQDPKFHMGLEKWMRKYLFEGDTNWVQKFSQARQTHAAMKRLMDKKTEELLRSYFDEG